MLLGTPLNLGNTTSDLRIQKGCTKIIKIFGSCQLWDAPKRKDPIISSMRCSHDPFLSLKTFPRKPSNSSKISSNPSKVTIGFFIALGAAVRNIHKEAFIWTLMRPNAVLATSWEGGELWNFAGTFAALRHWPHNPAKIQRRRLPHQCHPPRSDLSRSFSPQWLTSVSSGCVIGQSSPSIRIWWFTFKSKVRSKFEVLFNSQQPK